jgi:hypothetical protein
MDKKLSYHCGQFYNYGLLDLDTDVSEKPSLHLPNTTVCRQQVTPKYWHILTELHAVICHKPVPHGSLTEPFSTSGYTEGIHGSISDKNGEKRW